MSDDAEKKPSSSPERRREADADLSVDDVRHLLEVSSRATVLNWVKPKSGPPKLPAREVDGNWRIRYSDLLRAKLLTPKAVLARPDVKAAGISAVKLSEAIAKRGIEPEGKRRLLSLGDVYRLTGAPLPSDRVDAVPKDSSPAPSGSGAEPAAASPPPRRGSKRWAALLAYILDHGDPYQLPDEFWAAYARRPAFIPPAGVHLCTFTSVRVVVEGKITTFVRRTAGWTTDTDGSLVAVPPSEQHRAFFGLHEEDDEPIACAADNLEYREIEREWMDAWAQHCRRTGRPLCGDDGRRDRRALIRRYLEGEWSPSDLPAWYWDTPEEPPFVPPLNECKYSWGAKVEHNGKTCTQIIRSPCWELDDQGELELHPQMPAMTPVVGAYDDGDDDNAMPSECSAANRRFELAREEWAQCYRLYGPRNKASARTDSPPGDARPERSLDASEGSAATADPSRERGSFN